MVIRLSIPAGGSQVMVTSNVTIPPFPVEFLKNNIPQAFYLCILCTINRMKTEKVRLGYSFSYVEIIRPVNEQKADMREFNMFTAADDIYGSILELDQITYN